MKLKKDKFHVLDEIQATVNASAINALRYSAAYSDISQIIADAIALGVRIGIEQLLANQYTEEDFENDLGLNK